MKERGRKVEQGLKSRGKGRGKGHDVGLRYYRKGSYVALKESKVKGGTGHGWGHAFTAS